MFKEKKNKQTPQNPTEQNVHNGVKVVVDICSVEGDCIKRGASGESCSQPKIVEYTLQTRFSCLQIQRWPVGASNCAFLESENYRDAVKTALERTIVS